MTNLSNDLIKKLKKDTDFQVFLEYIVETIIDLGSPESYDLKDDNNSLGEQLRANILSRNKLYEILKPFVELREKDEVTKEQIEKTKSSYGL